MNLSDHMENFARRIVQDALNEATAEYWVRRARQFEGVGNARCDEIALACRNHSTICEFQDFDEIYDAVSRDVTGVTEVTPTPQTREAA